MTTTRKETVKNLLGRVPFTAELYWLLRQQGRPIQSRFSLRHLQAALPEMVAQALKLREASGMQQSTEPGRKIFLFASLHYWIEHTAVLGMALAAQGHQVTLGYLPYADWKTPVNRFDLRRQNVYAKNVLSQARPLIEPISFFNRKTRYRVLPDDIARAVQQVSNYDTQYNLQVEEVDTSSDIYRMRLERNQEAARAALTWFKYKRPDVVIVPNGTIQEMGIIYRVARLMNIPVVTYEFGDERQHIWLAQNDEIMHQETGSLWDARKDQPLNDRQLERLHSLITARQRATLWENFMRLWQGIPAQGGEKVKETLGLDDRPIVLLATNVLGDSLTLGRQVFTKNMSEWISRTVQYFTGRPDIQLVIRVHPGEVLVHGLSMMEVVKGVLPKLPEYIHLIGPAEKINTYDIVEVADLGLVYSTTVGLEMAMSGHPVIVAGQTHYRERGFTYDPDSWVSYFKLLGEMLQKPQKYGLSREKVDLAWRYAYHFFFSFPQPFPWHIVRLWEDLKARPLSLVLGSPEERVKYERTFSYLAGQSVDWNISND